MVYKCHKFHRRSGRRGCFDHKRHKHSNILVTFYLVQFSQMIKFQKEIQWKIINEISKLQDAYRRLF